MVQRTSAQIKNEIIAKFGFFPPFFEPAFPTPGVLDSLWQQTLAAYVDNPIPALFKEKLAASIARFCTVPYCLLCHSSTLRPLGMKSSDVLALLQEEPLGHADLVDRIRRLESAPLDRWPEANSDIEDGIYYCSLAIFLNQDTESCQSKLRQILPTELYDYLNLFLAYNRTCLTWAEAHPELNYYADQRVQDHYAALVAEDPKLADFFDNYRGVVIEQADRRAEWLTQKNKLLMTELKHSQEWLSATLHGIGDAVIATDTGTVPRITYLNGVAEELTGWTLPEAKGRSVYDVFNIINEQTRDPAVNPISAVVATGKVQGLANHTVLVRRDGQEFVIEDSAAPIKNADGTTRGVVLIFRDVTEQRVLSREREAANLKVEQSAKELEAFFMQAPAPMVILDGPDHFVTLANPLYERLINREVVGRTIKEAFPGGEADSYIPILDRVYQTGEPYIGRNLPLHLPDENGVTQELRIDVGYHPKRSTSGEISGVLALVQDVTEASKARKILDQNLIKVADSEEKLKLALDTGKIGFYDWDLVTNQVTYSDKMKEDWGFAVSEHPTLEEILTRFHPEDSGRVTALMKDAIDNRKSYFAAYRVVQPGGHIAWLEIHGRITYDEHGKPLHFYGTSINVTESRLAAEELRKSKTNAEQANQTKSAFLANMSHEIRTPLGAILGFTDLLKDARLTGEEREYLDVISRSGAALSHVIDDILDLSKVEAGQLKIESLPFDLRNLVKDVVTLFSDSARSKELKLLFESDLPPHHVILSDPIRIRQVLVNLIGNAIKFTKNGGVSVVLSTPAVKTSPPTFEVRIRDTGRGLSPEQASRLFQPFVQADDSTSRNFGGTGLGLALSRRLANALGGDVLIETSELGNGSTFLFRFAAETSGSLFHEEVQLVSPSSRDGGLKLLAGKSVLIVDDSPDNRVLMNVFLRRNGAAPDEAASGEEALEKAARNDYDVVLMDIQMPGMDGYDTLAALKKREYSKPVIALTAHAMVEERRRTQTAGFVDHVTKPVDVATLVAAILKHT